MKEMISYHRGVKAKALYVIQTDWLSSFSSAQQSPRTVILHDTFHIFWSVMSSVYWFSLSLNPSFPWLWQPQTSTPMPGFKSGSSVMRGGDVECYTTVSRQLTNIYLPYDGLNFWCTCKTVIECFGRNWIKWYRQEIAVIKFY